MVTPATPPRAASAPTRAERPAGSRWDRARVLARLPIALLLLVALLGATAVLVETRHGPGFEPDSAVYVGVAHNLDHGRGLTVPFTTYTDRYTPVQALAHYGRFPLQHFPPLYPLALAIGGAGSLWIRLLGSLLFAVNLMLVGLLALRMARRFWVAALGAAVVTLVSPGVVFLIPWVLIHAGALSEPMFLACTLGAMLALVTWLDSERTRWLWVAAGLAAAGLLTRYIGFTVVLAGAATVLLWARGTLRVRARSAALFAAVGLVPGVAFLVIQRARGTATRTLRYHPPGQVIRSLRHLTTTWVGFGSWPEPFTYVVPAVIAIGLVATAVYVAPRRRDEPGITVIRLLLLFVPVYILGVWAARTWFDASTPFDDRLLAPVRGALYLLLFGVPAWLLAGHVRSHRVGMGVSAGFLAAVALMSGPAAHPLERTVTSGGSVTTDLAVIRRVLHGVRPGTFIATNQPDRVYLATGRSSIFVPPHRYPVTDEPNLRFRAQVLELGQVLRRERGVLVMSDDVTFLTYRARPNQIRQILPQLHTVAHAGHFWVLAMDR